MKVKWLGHASFCLTSDDGVRIITDPYKPGGPITYAPITEPADIVTISHEHGDHSYAEAVRGNPSVVRGVVEKTIKGVAIKGVATFHDTAQGAQRGRNTVFCITADGVRVAHLGDLGHMLDKQQLQEMGDVDILLTPVGGSYAIDGPTAFRLTQALNPRVVIPMHFRNAGCAYPITDAEPFLKGCSDIARMPVSELEFRRDGLPKATRAVVLTPAL